MSTHAAEPEPGRQAKPKAVSKTKGSLYLVSANAVAVLIQIVSVPLILRAIGKPAYGDYVNLFAIANAVILASPNLLIAAQKRITEAHHAQDEPLMWRVQRTQMKFCLGVAGTGILAFALLGLLYRPPNAASAPQTFALMFAFAGVFYAAVIMNATLVSVIAATERFRELAIRQTLDKLFSALGSLGFALAFRTPAALFAGLALGAWIGFAVNAWTMTRVASHVDRNQPFDRSVLKDLLGIFFRGYPHRIFAGIATSADRLAMPYAHAPAERVADYGICNRIPELVNTLLSPVADTVVPDLTKKASENMKAFAESLDRQALVVLLLGLAFIAVPCSLGGPLLVLWQGDLAPVDGAWIMVLLGLHFALQLYFNLLCRPFYALGNLHHIAPISALSLLLRLVLTVVAYNQAGLIGVAGMNAGLSLIQIAPFLVQIKRHAAQDLVVGAHVGKVLALLAIAAALAFAGFELSIQPFVGRHLWLSVPAAGLLAVLMVVVATQLRLVRLPDQLQRRFVRR